MKNFFLIKIFWRSKVNLFFKILLVDREKEEYFKNPFSINFDTENYNFNLNNENFVMFYEESIKVEYEEIDIIF